MKIRVTLALLAALLLPVLAVVAPSGAPWSVPQQQWTSGEDSPASGSKADTPSEFGSWPLGMAP